MFIRDFGVCIYLLQLWFRNWWSVGLSWGNDFIPTSKLLHTRGGQNLISHGLSHNKSFFYPSALRAGGVLSSRSGRAGGRAGGCQTCGTHISVTAWWIFSVRSSMELSRPVVVHCHAHLPICCIWACPWAENLSNLPQIGSISLRIAYLWNRWMDLPHLKFHGLV